MALDTFMTRRGNASKKSNIFRTIKKEIDESYFVRRKK